MKSFSLKSNLGRASTTWIFRTVGQRQEELVFGLEAKGDFWDRAVDLSVAGLVTDSVVNLPQVICLRSELHSLYRHLIRWLDANTGFCVVLSDDESQSLTISLGIDERFISSPTKPVFSGSYSAGPSFKVEWAFVVDQSCVRLMMEELKGVLDHVGSR